MFFYSNLSLSRFKVNIAFFVISSIFMLFLLSSCTTPVYLKAEIYEDASSNPAEVPTSVQAEEVYIDFYFRGGIRMYDFIDGPNNTTSASNSVYVKALSNCFNAHVDISEWASVSFTYNKYMPEGLFRYEDESFFKRNFDKKRFYTSGFDERYNDLNNIKRLYQWRLTQEDAIGGKTAADLGLPPTTKCSFDNLADVIAKQSGENRMSVITMNFYEDRWDYKSFVDLYSNAFKTGFGGSIFCIESDFFGENMPQAEPGSIWEQIILPNGGVKFNFYIMIVGPAEQVRAYSDSLTRALTKDGITNFYSSYFLPINSKTKGSVEIPDNVKFSDIVHTVNPVYAISQNINNESYIASSVNAGLNEENGSPVSRVKNRIKTKEYAVTQEPAKDSDSDDAAASAPAKRPPKITIKDADVLSIKPLGKSTRYIVGIPVSEKSPASSFVYSEDVKSAALHRYVPKEEAFEPYNIDFFKHIDIRIIKPGDDIYGELETYSREKHSRIADNANMIYVELYIDSNANLPKENMRLDLPLKYEYDFGIIPSWVESKSVTTIDELNRHLEQNKEIKNLNLSAAYTGILNELDKYVSDSDKVIYTLPIYIINN